ncbi:MAG TPA: heliorhodopsin HeR [Candidatus Methanofastidiosa archaeon]|nr:heliorhodopsin HeR [Candidatus Methanofastidiosa archaeon]
MTTKDDEKTFKGLKNFNLFMGCLHLVQSLLILYLSNGYSLPIKSFYVKFFVETQSLETVMEDMVSVPLGPLIALFLLISAVCHFYLSTIGFEWYVKNLKRHINYLRWYEYALSSSIMIVVIAMLTGIYDIAALIPIFMINGTMNLFGLMMELYNQDREKVSWTAYIFGCIAGSAPWIVIAMYLAGAGGDGGGVPDFVYYIFVSLFTFFMSFAVNMALQYKGVGRWKDYYYGEKMYIVLSLVSKSLLAWQVFFGTLRGI